MIPFIRVTWADDETGQCPLDFRWEARYYYHGGVVVHDGRVLMRDARITRMWIGGHAVPVAVHPDGIYMIENNVMVRVDVF